MSSLLYEEEVKQLLKMGVNYDLAVFTASSKLEDKTTLNSVLNKMKADNEVIQNEIEKLGFRPSYLCFQEEIKGEVILSNDTIEDEPTNNNKVEDIQHIK